MCCVGLWVGGGHADVWGLMVQPVSERKCVCKSALHTGDTAVYWKLLRHGPLEPAHVCTHTCICTNMCAHMYMHTRACTHISHTQSLHTHKHACTHEHAHTCMHGHMHTRRPEHTHTCTQAHAHTKACTRTHTHMYAHMHADTPRPSPRIWSQWVLEPPVTITSWHL